MEENGGRTSELRSPVASTTTDWASPSSRSSWLLGTVVRSGMGERVEPDVVAVRDHRGEQLRVLRGGRADNEEGRVDVIPTQDGEHLGSPGGVGTVVEGERESGAARVAVRGTAPRASMTGPPERT